jgi:hypothetical protein
LRVNKRLPTVGEQEADKYVKKRRKDWQRCVGSPGTSVAEQAATQEEVWKQAATKP